MHILLMMIVPFMVIEGHMKVIIERFLDITMPGNIVTSVIVASRGLDLAMPEEPPDRGGIVMQDSLDIHVTAGGGIEVDKQPMEIHEILPYVRDRLKLAPDKPIILRTDANASYFEMIDVLDELRQSPQKIGMELDNLVIPTLREQRVYWE